MDNLQYYPTGERTAALMWSKFKRPVRHVCDPSAGKGNLLRYAKQGFPGLSEEEIPWLQEVEDEEYQQGRWRIRLRENARQKFSQVSEFSAIEIDLQHHANLKELGVKVLGFDFMDVCSLATVSHVIANPPFMAGCAHLLHAWDSVYDAELVFIINAETIRNPYTVERKRLVSLIERHGSVEFLTDQFNGDDVERKTDVEVALVYLEKVPGQYVDVDALTANLRKGDNGAESDLNPEVCSALALPGNFISDTCFRFEQAVEAQRKASEALAVSNHLTSQLGFSLEEMQAKGVGSEAREAVSSIREEANRDFSERYADLKKRAWAQILRSSLLSDKLSNQARKRLEASAANIYDLEFTSANIHGFLRGVVESMGDIYKDMILLMFDSIIGRSNDNVVFYRSYKSNDKHRIGMRLKRTRFILPRFRLNFGGSLDYDCERFLSDLDKCWHYLHGGSGQFDGLVDAFRKNNVRSSERFTSRYFEFRFYAGAGTVHLFPKNPEVMEKMNRFVGQHRAWLPGDMNEANADFIKQYEKAESLSDEYLKAFASSGRGMYGDQTAPVYKLLRIAQGTDSEGDEHLVNRLDAAIEAVHASRGLRCGPAIEAPSTLKAIGMNPPASVEVDTAEQPEQLLLLA